LSSPAALTADVSTRKMRDGEMAGTYNNMGSAAETWVVLLIAIPWAFRLRVV
jgi:hypothetical protein